jgi:two-component system chemotaxis response regulator CheB
MIRRDIIVIGASAGGVDALMRLARHLPQGFPASLFVVFHVPPTSRSLLPEILSRNGPLLAAHARDGEPFYPGQIYVAPPDFHLLLAPGGRLRLSRGARENRHRPAVDVLFRSAARYYGRRVIGVVLTGSMYDGSAGLLAVRAAGGLAVVQDPGDAPVADMPYNASQVAGADFVVPIAELADVLIKQVGQPIAEPKNAPATNPPDRMAETVETAMAEQARTERRGEVSVFTCPECGGTLWQTDDEQLLQFRCHVGHNYSAEALLSEQRENLEAALWTAGRTFRENGVLSRQLAAMERARKNTDVAARFDEHAERATRYGELIERFILGRAPRTPGPAAPASNGAAPPSGATPDSQGRIETGPTHSG